MPDESAEIIATAALVLAIGNGKKKGNDKKTVAKKAPAKKLITKKVTKVKKR
jgi:hypothetical protein